MAAGEGPAGRSGTPAARKLGIKDGSSVLLIDAPDGWQIPGVPKTVHVQRTSGSPPVTGSEIVVAFYRTAAELARSAPDVARRLPPTAALWIAWPRRAGGHRSDIGDRLLREALLPVGLVDVKVAALDRNWSGLKFVWRLENRPQSR